MFLIFAFVWTPSVMMPACAPVSETALRPSELIAIAVSAMVGGLLLSRVLVDGERSDAMLKAVRAGLAERAASAPR